MMRSIMKKITFSTLVFIILGCGREFEPDLSGRQVYTTPPNRLHMITNEQESVIELPGDERIGYRYPQWTRFEDHILLVQMIKTDSCVNYQIVTSNADGDII